MKRKNIALYITLCFTCIIFSQETVTQNLHSKVTIPFELVSNLMIIKADLNNTSLQFIVDSGSSRNLIFSFPEKDSLSLYNPRTINVFGLGATDTIKAFQSKNNTLSIKKYTDTNFETLVITDYDIKIINKLGVPINGILGSSFFKDKWVEIDYENKKIHLYPKENQKPLKKVKNYSVKNILLKDNKPYINTFIKPEPFKNYSNTLLLFDTGLVDGLWLFENDSINCPKKHIYDILGRGLSGDITGKRARIEEFTLDDFSLKDILVAYPDSLSYNKALLLKERKGSLGAEIIKRFNWIINYDKQKVYFKKNSNFYNEFKYNMSGIEAQHIGMQWVTEESRIDEKKIHEVNINQQIFNNAKASYYYKFVLKPIYEIYAIRENSPAYKAGLLVGDIILELNGKKVYNLSMEKINELFMSNEGKEIKIVVERNNTELSFSFKLEKIL